jgi:hypothetical protein
VYELANQQGTPTSLLISLEFPFAISYRVSTEPLTNPPYGAPAQSPSDAQQTTAAPSHLGVVAITKSNKNHYTNNASIVLKDANSLNNAVEHS